MNNSVTSPSSEVDPALPGSDHTADDVSAAAIEVRRLYEALAGQRSLAPGAGVDLLFSRLVDLVVALGAREGEAVLADPGVQSVRPDLLRLCATGETALERAWSARITGAADPATELERFPYLGNYRLLCDLEWNAVLGAGRSRPRRVAFLGAGPLPLSAIVLHRTHDVPVDGFDRDHRAVDQARAVVGALGLTGLRMARGDTARCPDLRAYDLVVLAALVGTAPGAKQEAIRCVHERMRPGALLAARSAHAARALLYPVLDLDDLAGLEPLSVVHPLNQVINSVVVARKPAPGAPAPDSFPRWATAPTPADEAHPWHAS